MAKNTDSNIDNKDVKVISKSPTKKPKASIRERNKKILESQHKPKRIRKAAVQARRPVSKISQILQTEYHVLPRKNKDGFFSKSRSTLPVYIHKSLVELKNVTWPKRKETWSLVFAVFMFAITVGVFISLVDYGLEQLFKQIIT